jgi:hypothetical protein
MVDLVLLLVYVVDHPAHILVLRVSSLTTNDVSLTVDVVLPVVNTNVEVLSSISLLFYRRCVSFLSCLVKFWFLWGFNLRRVSSKAWLTECPTLWFSFIVCSNLVKTYRIAFTTFSNFAKIWKSHPIFLTFLI